MAGASGNELALTYAQQRPVDAARVLESQQPEHAAAFLAGIPTRTAAAVLEHMLPGSAAACMQPLPDERAAAILQRLAPVQGAGVLRTVDRSRCERLLSGLPTARSIALRMLLDYPPDTIGAWMDPRLFTLPVDCQVGAALTRIGRSPEPVGDRVYVLGEDQVLIGEVSVVELVRTSRQARIADCIQTVGEVLVARRSLLAVRELAAWSNADRLPVVNRRGQLVGALHHASLRRALAELAPAESEERELAAALSGVAELYWVGISKAFVVLLALAGVRTDTPPGRTR